MIYGATTIESFGYDPACGDVNGDGYSDVIVIRQIRSLLYEQGFTIGGARNQLTGDEARHDVSQSQQIVRQLMRMEEEARVMLQ